MGQRQPWRPNKAWATTSLWKALWAVQPLVGGCNGNSIIFGCKVAKGGEWNSFYGRVSGYQFFSTFLKVKLSLIPAMISISITKVWQLPLVTNSLIGRLEIYGNIPLLQIMLANWFLLGMSVNAACVSQHALHLTKRYYIITFCQFYFSPHRWLRLKLNCPPL